MRKFLDYFLVVVALVIGVIVYFKFDLEGILWDKEKQITVDAAQMEADVVTDYTGLKAGNGVLSLTTGEEWEAVINEIDYVTVVPVSIEETDVYSLAKWTDYYTRRKSGAAGRRLEEAKKTSLDISANYSPFYIIELEDGTRLLAQMNRGLAAKIEKGQEVELPLGRKIGISQKARNLLAPVCESLHVSTDYVLYTINDAWEAQNADKIFFGKLAVAIVTAIVLAIVFQLIAGKIFPENEPEETDTPQNPE